MDGHLWLRKKAYNFPWDPGASLLVFFPQKSQVPAPMNGHEERAAWRKRALPGLGHPHSREIPPRAHSFAGGYWQRHQALQSTGSYSARYMELWDKMPGYFLGFQRLLNINPTKQTSENTRSSLHTPTVTQAMMTLGDQLFCRMKSHHRAQGWHKCWQEIIKLYSSRCNSREDKWVGARREAAKMNRDCKTQ